MELNNNKTAPIVQEMDKNQLSLAESNGGECNRLITNKKQNI